MRIPVILSLFLLTVTPISSFALDFSALGGWNFAAPTETVTGADLHWTGDSGFSFGATVAAQLFETPFEFETGFFKLKENSTRNADITSLLTGRQNDISVVPAIIRYMFDDHIAIGGGVYFGFGSKDPSLQTTDFGILLNARARMIISGPFSFLIDGRYQHGLGNRLLSTSGLYNTRSIHGFVGFQYAWDTTSEPEVQMPHYR
ncbi:MAG: hypothetical protein JST80_05015 [Bdellovibrionales bacterium]|nr:hypothetical protein [Bdellovibrionales bacterium]